MIIDGFVSGLWRIEGAGGTATLMIRPFSPLQTRDRTTGADEGARLLAIAAANSQVHTVQFTATACSARPSGCVLGRRSVLCRYAL